jgi:hypothetical protein
VRDEDVDDAAIDGAGDGADHPVDGGTNRATDACLHDDDGRDYRPVALGEAKRMGKAEGENSRNKDAKGQPEFDAMARDPVDSCRSLVRVSHSNQSRRPNPRPVDGSAGRGVRPGG